MSKNSHFRGREFPVKGIPVEKVSLSTMQKLKTVC